LIGNYRDDNASYNKLYLHIIVLLMIFLALFGGGFALFAHYVMKYGILTSVLCSVFVTAVAFKDLAKLSAIIVIQFSDVEYSDDIPDNKVIRIKDYLKKKGRV